MCSPMANCQNRSTAPDTRTIGTTIAPARRNLGNRARGVEIMTRFVSALTTPNGPCDRADNAARYPGRDPLESPGSTGRRNETAYKDQPITTIPRDRFMFQLLVA